ncbi:hypothetical protein L2E82_35240 [Cichorium intybus]|uniref:Uncharacterized protein n=1 Tax=Cichorium intybus TaxID=13427 RepID=A0ACB9BNH9_CICIN|nr:hypothetical protein L2E82_35240 [Cichorium intybus]
MLRYEDELARKRMQVLNSNIDLKVVVLSDLHYHGSSYTYQGESEVENPWSPYLDISCINDLTKLYEAATIEDVYLAYEQLKIDEQSLITKMTEKKMTRGFAEKAHQEAIQAQLDIEKQRKLAEDQMNLVQQQA